MPEWQSLTGLQHFLTRSGNPIPEYGKLDRDHSTESNVIPAFEVLRLLLGHPFLQPVLSFSCFVPSSVLDACYLGFTLVTSGYVQDFRCQKEVWFPFDIPMVLFT